MNSKVRTPGFTAAVVLESTTQQNYYARAHNVLSSQQAVTPQRGFLCGLGFAAIIGGIASGQVGAVIAGLALVANEC